jgi:hypothetical protein
MSSTFETDAQINPKKLFFFKKVKPFHEPIPLKYIVGIKKKKFLLNSCFPNLKGKDDFWIWIQYEKSQLQLNIIKICRNSQDTVPLNLVYVNSSTANTEISVYICKSNDDI